MLYKSIDQIDISDMQALIDNEVGESKTIEYKSELKIDLGDDRKEFLADITSFANADGGDILFGIKEDAKTNLPTELCGIEMEIDTPIILQPMLDSIWNACGYISCSAYTEAGEFLGLEQSNHYF